MVTDYYGLKEQPFGVTPDSRYLYSSATHREALASLLYSVEVGRGFAALIAQPGMGKTTLLFHALNELKDRAKSVFLYQTISTPAEFLHALLADLDVHDTQSNLVELQAKLNEVVAEQSRSGKPLIVVIDEAQALDNPVLEMVRMLSNFETSREKLIQIVLSGQPQLADKLASPELVQLRQRVSIVACLKPFSPEETALYINHRLRVAGYSADQPLFTNNALDLIAEGSGGIPRNINNLCFNALSLGCALKRTPINCDIIREVIADLDLDPLRQKKPPVREPVREPAPEPVPEWMREPALEPVREWMPPLAPEPARLWMPEPVREWAPAPALEILPEPVPLPEATQKVPPSALRSQSLPEGWLPKVAVACAVLVLLGGVLFESPRWVAITAKARNMAAPFTATSTSQVSADHPPPIASSTTVQVAEGQTLYVICVQKFGSCSQELIQQIQTLNPWLSDINHIEPGQAIRMPVVKGVNGTGQSMHKQSGNNLYTKRATQ